MLLTVQHILDATVTLSTIIREARPMSQRGKYKLARMHAKLLPEFNVASARRDEMITLHGVQQAPPEGMDPTGKEPFEVPLDKMDEYTAAWKEVGDTEIEVDVCPIPLADFDLGPGTNGAIEANELIVLGDLVSE